MISRADTGPLKHNRVFCSGSGIRREWFSDKSSWFDRLIRPASGFLKTIAEQSIVFAGAYPKTAAKFESAASNLTRVELPDGSLRSELASH